MKVTLIGLNHEVQWKDPTGHLRQTLSDLLTSSEIDLIAEEASGLPTTVGQRLSCKLNKPWIDMDMTRAERIEAGIGESVQRWGVIEEGDKLIEVFWYIPEFDDVREKHWLNRLLKCGVQTALCLCGVLHVATFKIKLEACGSTVEVLKLHDQEWFIAQYGNYCTVEQNGNRRCEIRRP